LAQVTFDGDLIGLSADYVVTKTLLSPTNGVARVGEAVVFQISVVNTGEVTLTTVTVEDRYDTAYLTFVNAVPPADDAINDGILNWRTSTSGPGRQHQPDRDLHRGGQHRGQPATNVVVASRACRVSRTCRC